MRVSAMFFMMVFLASCGGGPDGGDVIAVKGVEMVYVPGGTFVMGEAGAEQCTVTVKPFLIDKYEVTNAKFREFAKVFGIPFPVPTAYDDYPVIGQTWYMADAYSAWRNCSLPTEAQWEYAARGTDGRKFPWGDKWDATRANGNDDQSAKDPALYGKKDGFPNVAPVGLFARGASPFGALDMAGNVWEWVGDWFAPLPKSAVVDYRGPVKGGAKCLRGGSFRLSSINLRTIHRGFREPGKSTPDIGFRCASPWPVPAEPSLLPVEIVPAGTDTVKIQ
jgi:eukaryotic-like serine/threonine-protein kinase